MKVLVKLLKNQNLTAGILLIVASALCTTFGQLCWKLGTKSILFLLVGFALYGLGALLMIYAFRFGEVSVLHPMLSISYVLSLLLGTLLLNESVTPRKIGGILCVICGTIFLGLSAAKGKRVE